MTDKKACVGCRFFRPVRDGRCSHPSAREFDWVKGWMNVNAKGARSISGPCGHEARLFEPWPPANWTDWIGPAIMATMIIAAVLKMWGAW